MSKAYKFDPTSLREYDIRGIIGKTLGEDDARAIGHAFGSMVVRDGGKSIAVGRDGRFSSLSLANALVEGLVSTGLKVKRIGLGPSPMLYFSTIYLNTDAGVMITGSHNPPDYNGFKMLTTSGPVYGDKIMEIGRVAAKGDYVTSDEGTIEEVDIKEAYIDRIMKDYDGGKELTIAWDAGNGAAGETLKMLTDRLPGKHILLFDDIDGSFPNHHPDPTVDKNLDDLRKAVAENNCDIGIGFDGDGDRIGCIDEKGNMIFGDQLMAIYAKEVLATNPGATIIADVKCSKILFDEIEKLGGKPLMWRTGHSVIKAKMREIGSPLGGEISGHICFADKFYGFDDALYNAVRLINIVSKSDKTIGEMIAEFPKTFATPEARFQVDETRKFDIAGEINDRLKNDDNYTISTMDGVRVNTKDGWFLLRASNTQDVLSGRVEATSKEGLARIKSLLSEQLTASGIDTPPEFQ